MNRLTDQELGVEDRLFHTLSTTVRKWRLKGNQKADIIDTVGFISHLPHSLIECFKSTLEEIMYADILLHVRDISHPMHEYQNETVIKVLKEIGIADSLLNEGFIEVFNKADLVESHLIKDPTKQVAISALSGNGVNNLIDVIATKVKDIMGLQSYTLKYNASLHDKVSLWLLKHANVTQIDDMEFEGDKIIVNVNIDDVVYQQYLKTFERDKFESLKGSRLKPPKGW